MTTTPMTDKKTEGKRIMDDTARIKADIKAQADLIKRKVKLTNDKVIRSDATPI